MTESMISVRDAGKRYVHFADTPTLVGRALQLRNRSRRSDLWAVRNVALEAVPGECIGIIGRNGSGKSTMLRMLAGVTSPSEGSVTVRGRVAPLIAVGVGFHPELTGRENVFLSSAILGRSEADTATAFDEIVAFADIGDFLDTPVKFYSSGMFVRLGFSVAISIQPEVLLVDEVLAVGDIGFQQRCFTRIRELRSDGTTIVLVSHNLLAVSRLCDRTMVLHDGTQRFLGDTGEALGVYHHLLATDGVPGAVAPLRVEHARLTDAQDQDAQSVAVGDPVTLHLSLRCEEPFVDPVFNVQVVNEAGVLAYARTSDWDRSRDYDAGDTIELSIDFRATLAGGSFTVHVGAVDQRNRLLLPLQQLTSFYVHGAARAQGVADLDAGFSFGD